MKNKASSPWEKSYQAQTTKEQDKSPGISKIINNKCHKYENTQASD